MTTWQTKAHRIIADLARQSYEQANRKQDGSRYKRHRPYSLPVIAAELVRCLGANDEHSAKAIFLQLNTTPELARD